MANETRRASAATRAVQGPLGVSIFQSVNEPGERESGATLSRI